MPVILSDSLLKLKDFSSIILKSDDFAISEERYSKLKESHDFLSDFSNAFGAMLNKFQCF